MKYQPIYNRLRRIEGQIRGIEEMLTKDRPDEEIIVQLEAVKSSVASTLSAFIEAKLDHKEDGKVVLSESEVRAILRSIK